MSKIKNTKLAPSGMLQYQWTRDRMPILLNIINANHKKKPLCGLKVGFCLQLTAETAVLVLGVKKLGAQVFASSGNPLTTNDAIAAYLDSVGVDVYGWSNQTSTEFAKCVDTVLKKNPDIIADDGAELSTRAHVDARFSKMKILGGTEETTTGVRRILALEKKTSVRFPIIAVNDADTKRMFDNRYGTGQSTIDGLLRATGVLLASKIAIVAGFGHVGRGVAERLRAFGCKVVITETDPIKALEAYMDGYEVMPMMQAASFGEIFITCTGNSEIITSDHIKLMKSGAILANAGHFDVEINTKHLKWHKIKPHLYVHDMRGKKIYLVSQGRVVNLAAAEGHPPEIMDLSFANHLLCILHVYKNRAHMEKQVYKVPKTIDESVAHLALRTACIRIDKLSKKQRQYALTGNVLNHE